MSSFGRVRPGQAWKPPRADQQNAWDLAAEFYAIKQRLSVALSKKERMPVPTELDVIKVRNDTGADRLPGQIVQLDVEIIDTPTRLHPWVSGITPTSRCDRYAILRYATKSNKIRWAQVSGPTFALVDITNGHKKCSPKFSQHHLFGDDDGPIPILWKPDAETTGVHECIVGMGQPLPPGAYVAKIPTGGIPPRDGLYPGTATCEIWRLEPHDYTGPGAKSLVAVLKPDATTLTKAVYNLSLSEIAEAVEYHPIHREECGNWFTTAAASSPNCGDITFKILSTGTNALGIRWAKVQILARPCGCEEVPEEVELIVVQPSTLGPGIDRIYDLAGCFLNEPDADLVNRVGFAKYMQDLRFIESPIEPGGPVPDCTWSIHSLCCPTCDAVVTETSSPSSGDSPSAMITGDGPGPIPGQFLE